MKETLRNSNVPTMLLSVLLSVALWTTVQLATDKQRQQPIYNVPVRITGEDTLMTNAGFSVIEGKEETIRVDIEARGSDVADLNKKNMEDIYAEARVGAITEAGRTKVQYELHYPNNITIRSMSPRYIEVWVDKVISREISVQPYTEGTPADGYIYDSLTPDQQTVVVSGPEAIVNQIRYARATLTAEGATGSLTDAAAVTFLDGEGNVIDSDENHLEIVSGGVNLSLRVLKEAIVPLRVEVLEAPGITAAMATVNIDPVSIKVRGEPALVDKLAEEGIVISQIDLGTFAGTPQTVAIRTPEGVQAVNGEPRYATISVELQGVTTREFELTDIEVELEGADGWEALMLSGSVPVTVRGPSALVDSMTEEQIHATARLTLEGEVTAGVQQAELTITLENAEGAAVTEAPELVNVMLRTPIERPEAPSEDEADPAFEEEQEPEGDEDVPPEGEETE